MSSNYIVEDGIRQARMHNACVALLEVMDRAAGSEDAKAISSRALRAHVFQRMAMDGVPHVMPAPGEPTNGDLRAWTDAVAGHGLRLRLAKVAGEQVIALNERTAATCRRFLLDPNGFRPDGIIFELADIPPIRLPEPDEAEQRVPVPEDALRIDELDSLMAEQEEAAQ